MELSEKPTEFKQIEGIFSVQKNTSQRLRQSTVAERITKLNSLKKWIRNNKEVIRKAIYKDLGKPHLEADITEIYVVLSDIKFACNGLAKWVKPKPVKIHWPLIGSRSYIQYEPKGCALIIAPWNYPFNLAIGPLISAIAAGCTAVIKPSEIAPHTSAMIAAMIVELFRKDEVAVVEGGKETAEKLLSLPFDHVFFTGSPQVGKSIMKAASEHLSSLTLELGGKSPVIIDQGCNLAEVAERVIWGKFINCGQTCVAPDFIMVHEGDLESLIKELKKQVANMFNADGKGTAQSPDYGRIINEHHLNRLKGLLSDGLAKGAKVEYGGEVMHEHLYMEPTFMTQLGPNMDLMEQEIFGPILPILTYSDLNQVINYLNAKPKPLAMYIFSEESFFADYLLEHTSSGTAVINDCVLQFGHPGLPFGGVNSSGIGKAHGHFGFLAFSNEKAVLKQKTGLTSSKILYPPYGFKEKKILGFFMKYI